MTATRPARSFVVGAPGTQSQRSSPIGSRLSRLGDRHPILARLRAAAPIWALAMVITALAWPFLDLPAVPGLDQSWKIGLHLASWMDLC